MTIKKHQPFEQNTRKGDKAKAQNIEEHSGEVRLQAGTNSIENDKETTELQPSEWINATTMGHKEQTRKKKKQKGFPRCLKKWKIFIGC
jgi:hypothetical protein